MARVGAYEVRAIDLAEGAEAFRESDWELDVYPTMEKQLAKLKLNVTCICHNDRPRSP